MRQIDKQAEWQTLNVVFQVAQNVDKHQFNTFVKSKGLDPNALNDAEKVELRKDMMSELYPGKI